MFAPASLLTRPRKQLDKTAGVVLARPHGVLSASAELRVTEPGADLGINKATKYVATSRPLSTDWNRTAVRLEGDVAEEIRKLKAQPGPELQVHGSGTLIQTLLKHYLVDELWLKLFPVTIGTGRKLFAEGTRLAGFALVESSTSPSGVIVAKYKRAGEVKFGSFARPA